MSARCAALIAALAAWAPLSQAAAQSTDLPFTSASRYDPAGRVTGTIAPDPDGTGPLKFAATRNTFDAAGRLVMVESGQLQTWQSEAVAPAGWSGFELQQRVETLYDPLGFKLKETSSGVPSAGGAITVQTVTEYSYDPNGRLLCIAVRMNPAEFALQRDACTPGTPSVAYGPDRITSHSYDPAGQLVQTRQGVGTAVMIVEATRDYTPNGKLKALIDANGNRAEMRYDQFDRMQCWILPSKTRPAAYNPATQATALASAGGLGGDCATGDFEFYGYDANSSRTSHRKRDGSTLTYQYDGLNRMTAKFVPERAGLAAAQTRDVYYAYDLRGLQTEARFDSPAGEGVTNVFDGFGGLTSSSSNMGGIARAVGNLYDLDGNRIRVIHPDTSFFTYEVDGLGRPTVVRENGGAPIATFSYDASGRRATSGWAATTSYGYDPVGRLQALSHDLAGTSRDHVLGFTYNPASQIVTRSASNDAFAWTDPARYARSYTANGLNQYTGTTSTGAPAVSFLYDANGNLTSDGLHSFVYDIENRLVSATGAHNAELVYDPLGRLFQVSSGGAGIRRLVYDGDALIAEYDAAGNMPHRYIHGNDAGDDPLIWYENFAAGWRRALLTDHQGSVIQVADMYGNPVATDSYDAWGIPGANNSGRFGYTGQTWLPELGLWYYKARIYSPTQGRFLQVDPVGYEDQANLYAYVGNDPVNKTDPTGKWECVSNGNGTSSCTSTGLIDAVAMHIYIAINNIIVSRMAPRDRVYNENQSDEARQAERDHKASAAGQNVITDGERPAKGSRQIDNRGKGREVGQVIADAAAAAGVKPGQTKDGRPTVRFPDGSRATGYPASSTTGAPSIAISRPDGKERVKTREDRY